jgi:hypothetical protein
MNFLMALTYVISRTVWWNVTEGKGYCARRQERMSVKKLAEFIENRDNVIMVPDVTEAKP